MRAALVLLVVGCASGPQMHGPEVRPIDEDQLALLPSGADAIIDVDVEQLRGWPAARRFFSLLPPDARARLDQLGVDPWMDLDGIVLSLSGMGSDEPDTTVLLRGEINFDKMAHTLGVTFVEYRRAQIGEANGRAIVKLSPRMVAYGSPADVRRVIDLVRGEGQSVRTADHSLVAAFGRAPSAKVGRPAVIAATVPSDAMRDRLRTDDLPGSEYQSLTFVLAVGDGFDFEVIGRAKDSLQAGTLAASAKVSLDKLRTRTLVRLLGLSPYLEDIVIVDRAEEVRMVYRLAGRRVSQMLSNLEQLAAAAAPEKMTTLTIDGRSPALSGETRVPGDKSIGHRAVMLAAISSGRVIVRGLSGGEDNRRTVDALRALGVEIRAIETNALEIFGGTLREAAGELDCGNSGTSIRLLAGLLAARPFRSRLTGDEYLRARPMLRVAEPLRQMGAIIEGEVGKREGELYAPLVVGGRVPLHGIRWESRVASAQVKSAIILAALGAEGATTVVEPSRSRDHTERMLRALGAPLFVDGNSVTLDPRGWDGRLHPSELMVPGDLSSAAFLLAAATLVPRSRVKVRGVGVNPTRTGFLDALGKMGGKVVVENLREEGGEPVADLTASASELSGCEIAGELSVRSIDELPLLAALAAMAEGTTVIRDAAELRVKESDRVLSTVAMLRALGAEADERPDGLVVSGRAQKAGRSRSTVDSHGDHRIAMAGAVLALALPGATTIADTDNVATSFPGFAALLAQLGAPIR